MKKLYKITGPNGEPLHGGSGKWHLPRHGKPAKWMPVVENIEPCKRGYHLVEKGQLIEWVKEGVVWEAEGRGKCKKESDKSCYSQARLIRKVGTLTEKNLRLFACDCAERVLPIFEKERPCDDRPRKAIQAARDFANGKIVDAARAARMAAARDAAWDAAWAAAAVAAAGAAARAAACDAAWAAAARDAAVDAAGAAARDAAWAAAWAAAARDAAVDAARAAAWDAAWAAARDAARDAARAAARDAEKKYQTKRLFWYLTAPAAAE